MGKKDKTGKVKIGSEDVELNPIDVSDNVKKVKKKKKKKRPALPDLDVLSEENYHNDNAAATQDLLVVDDPDETTMGEKLEKLGLLEESKKEIPSAEESPAQIKLPSADSVHVMLKQALNAEDRELLLKCLSSRDEKVITNSISQLNPSDALKLLDSLISMTQLRGAVLVCALPWLKSLLVQHASSIIAQESATSKLNCLYQLIESRTSTFQSAIQLSTCLDFLFTEVLDDEAEDESIPLPVIYEDVDSDEENNDAMETDDEEDDRVELVSGYESPNVSEGSDVMSQ